MICPSCKTELSCPCESCRERLPDHKVWKWEKCYIISCTICGYAADADEWMKKEFEEIKRSEQ